MPSDPLVDWLVRVRRLILVAEGTLLLVAFATGERPVAGLALLVAFAVLEVARTLLRVSGSAVANGLVDTLALTALIAAWGEPHQPLQVFWLVDVALFAVFSSGARGWAATGAAIAGEALGLAAPLVGGWMATPEPPLHLLAHAATFALGAIALNVILGGVARANRESARALLQAEEHRERAARLAAIGALAAGVAHELATPLGSVELLAEEIADRPEAMAEIRAQLARCRTILDRMLARGEAPEGSTADLDRQLATWVQDWRRAAPAVDVTLDVAACGGALRGGPDGWRAALWTVLDNARQAGPPIRVVLASTGEGAEVCVEDAGPGVDEAVAERIGEPFLSAWPGRKGAGLGLYVARTFAREAGGDLRLERGERGARAVLTLRAVGGST